MPGFLTDPPDGPGAHALYADDLAEHGHVMGLSRVWAHRPELQTALFELLGAAGAGLSIRRRGLLVTAAARAREDGYCALAWGDRLAGAAGEDVAVAALTGDEGPLSETDRALVRFADQAARDPNGTTQTDVDALRAAGLDDAAVLSLTVFVALRIAFATVNGALGAAPDPELAAAVPPAVRAAVTFGRPAGD